MVNVHLDVNIENAAIKIIQSFGNQMQSCEKAHAKNELPAKADQIPLCTFYDEIEERAAAAAPKRKTSASLQNCLPSQEAPS